MAVVWSSMIIIRTFCYSQIISMRASSYVETLTFTTISTFTTNITIDVTHFNCDYHLKCNYKYRFEFENNC